VPWPTISYPRIEFYSTDTVVANLTAMHGDQKTLTDEEVRAILIKSMIDVEADPAIIYAFHKTGVYVCDENEHRLSPERLAAWNAAIDEYRLSFSN
jgi:hypothetical protein